jgi:hypothetical protein
MMSARPFPPLVLDLPAGRRTVASAYEALECLEAAWPITTGNAYRWAIQRAFDALDGFVEPEVARAALIRAAEEANIRGCGALPDRDRRPFGMRPGFAHESEARVD